MKHVLDTDKCPCRNVNVFSDSVIEIMGHRFKLSPGSFTGAEIADMIEEEGHDIGIHATSRDDGKLHIDASEYILKLGGSVAL